MADPLKVTVEGVEYDVDDFELGEMAWAEQQIGMAIDEALPMTQALAFVAIIKRRTDPDFTVEQASKLKLSVFDAPTAAPPASNGNGGRKRPPRKAGSSTPASSGASSSAKG